MKFSLRTCMFFSFLSPFWFCFSLDTYYRPLRASVNNQAICGVKWCDEEGEQELKIIHFVQLGHNDGWQAHER